MRNIVLTTLLFLAGCASPTAIVPTAPDPTAAHPIPAYK
jgi:hypothetical protein